MIKFITGNKNKLREFEQILGSVEQLDVDLPEIQEIDAQKIIEAKLKVAFEHDPGPFVVEDTSLYLDCLGKLPGPLIKWFLESMGPEGLYNICSKFGEFGATAKTVIGYAKAGEPNRYFEGELRGRIDAPKEGAGFGWDPIFRPEGYDKSFAEMDPELKNSISMRRLALDKLKDFLSD